jgi:hypothetical protein
VGDFSAHFIIELANLREDIDKFFIRGTLGVQRTKGAYDGMTLAC